MHLISLDIYGFLTNVNAGNFINIYGFQVKMSTQGILLDIYGFLPFSGPTWFRGGATF
jgi:hypothetical protein